MCQIKLTFLTLLLGACFTQAEAEALVQANYAMLVLDYPSFDETQTQITPGVPVATLVVVTLCSLHCNSLIVN